MQLYQLERFRVILGAHAGNGFCTVWNDPDALLKRLPELTERCRIIGTLYGRQGVSIIFRNLALNPTIRRLYLWGHGPLSQTPYGKSGTDLLFAAWKNGVADDGTIVGTSFRLDSGCRPEVIRMILQNVQLIDLSEVSVESLLEQIDRTTTTAFMEPVMFDAPEEVAPEQWPSEGVGWLVRGTGVIEAWKRVVQKILLYGTVKGTQYGMKQKELIHVTWVIGEEDPFHPNLPNDWPEELCQVTGASASSIAAYLPTITSGEPRPGTSYTYGNRLKQYPISTGCFDQITDGIIAPLKQSKDTRRAVATTIVPEIDGRSDKPPCLSFIQCLQSDDKLHLLATVRSHDIFKGAIANAYGLRALQYEIAQAVDLKIGSLSITSESAHLYEADLEQAEKLVRCSFTDREPSRVFDPKDADPRGNVVIRLQKGSIVCSLTTNDGVTLWETEGKKARTIQQKLTQMELLSSIGHAMDIGMELQKAEIALEREIIYAQDRPLTF